MCQDERIKDCNLGAQGSRQWLKARSRRWRMNEDCTCALVWSCKPHHDADRAANQDSLARICCPPRPTHRGFIDACVYGAWSATSLPRTYRAMSCGDLFCGRFERHMCLGERLLAGLATHVSSRPPMSKCAMSNGSTNLMINAKAYDVQELIDSDLHTRTYEVQELSESDWSTRTHEVQ